jgi:predicted ATPase
MKYRESDKDKKLRDWFSNDYSHGLLKRIELKKGKLRGLSEMDLSFDYPITAIAGKNGAGKSTILALACCAFHNKKKAYKPKDRKATYYTFSDFFIQHSSEISPVGIEINYSIAHNGWKKSSNLPSGVGLGMQKRFKKEAGKWNYYAGRVHRTVVFIGISRVVPHSERSQSRSYSKHFSEQAPLGWEDEVKDTVGYILGKNYDSLRFLEHSKYTLPVVEVAGVKYSGLNMGAGENALFEIFRVLYSVGNGALIVIDEIELGLHADAQRKLIQKLKESCIKLKSQVICTTHSKIVFQQLPPDGRRYVEAIGGKTKVTYSISPEFAMAKMGAKEGEELEIFVEDEVAKSLLSALLPTKLRSRVSIRVIGSAAALSRQLAAAFLRNPDKLVLAIFDGDQKSKYNHLLRHAKDMSETSSPEFVEWFKEKVSFLPGDTWPEAWIVQKNIETSQTLAQQVDADEDELCEFLEYGLQAGKHNEFYEIAEQLGFDELQCIQILTSNIKQNFEPEFHEIFTKIETALV